MVLANMVRAIGPSRIRALLWVAIAWSFCACTYQNYEGEKDPADVFLVEAVGGAVLGWHDTGLIYTQHSYYSRGRFAAGPAVFHAATDFDDCDDDEELNEDCDYVNLREIEFAGAGGEEYLLRPRLDWSRGMLSLATPDGYRGYEIVDKRTNVTVAVIP